MKKRTYTPTDDIYKSLVTKSDVGEFKLLRKTLHDGITYCDWNLKFSDITKASKPDNNGKDEVQIIFNLNQNIEWFIEDGKESVNMMAGEVCVFRNNDYQTCMTYSPSCSFEFKSLQMPTETFYSLLKKYLKPEQIEKYTELFLNQVTKTSITADMFKTLEDISDCEKYNEFSDIFCESKITELLALVLYSITYEKTDSIIRSRRYLNSDIKKMESLRKKINSNPAQEFNVKETAQNLMMSESKLNRMFRSLYGMTLHAYVSSTRLEKAKKLILNGSTNVSEAAILSGYTNLSHFSKEFQKRFGTSPKKFMTENR